MGTVCFSLNLEDEIERGSSGSKEKFVCSSVFLLIIKSPFWRVVTKTLSISFKIWRGRDFVLNLLKLFWCLLYRSIPLSFITQTRFFSSTKIFTIVYDSCHRDIEKSLFKFSDHFIMRATCQECSTSLSRQKLGWQFTAGASTEAVWASSRFPG